MKFLWSTHWKVKMHGKDHPRRWIKARGIEDIIPPPINACFREEEMRNRNKSLEMIKLLGNDVTARSIWKKYTRYHMRSLAETAFSSLKRFFGDRLQ